MKMRTLRRLDVSMWSLSYICYTVSGFFAFFLPSRAVAANLAQVGLLFWSAFFAVGGLLCLIGVLSKQWWGELTGLPLVAGGAAVYGGAVFAQYLNPATRDGAYLFVGTLLFGFALAIVARWIAKMINFRVAMKVGDEL